MTYKTAYYSFYLPVACGMLLAGITEEASYKLAEKILVAMGQFFQVRCKILVACMICVHEGGYSSLVFERRAGRSAEGWPTGKVVMATV